MDQTSFQEVGPPEVRWTTGFGHVPPRTGQVAEGRGCMSSNTSPTGVQHQGEASQSETPVLSTPYGQSEGVRRQSVFQAAANAAAPHARSANAASSGTKDEQGSTEEIEAVVPTPTSEPGAGSEPGDQPSTEGASGAESIVSAESTGATDTIGNAVGFTRTGRSFDEVGTVDGKCERVKRKGGRHGWNGIILARHYHNRDSVWFCIDDKNAV